MVVDLSHGSARQIDEVLETATRPVVVSHTGVRGTCDNNRNLSDNQLRSVAQNGGLVGIGFWETAVCGTDVSAIAAALRYAGKLIGADNVALGSDFDGSVKVPFDATGLAQVTGTLVDDGASEDDVAKIMGGNQIRFLLVNLPE
jgi:microsomal dipeptidase-like Zn-dependent dipeptidase